MITGILEMLDNYTFQYYCYMKNAPQYIHYILAHLWDLFFFTWFYFNDAVSTNY